MLKAERSFYPFAFPQKAPVFFCILFSTFISCFGGKIEPTVILASLEGEVHSFSRRTERLHCHPTADASGHLSPRHFRSGATDPRCL